MSFHHYRRLSEHWPDNTKDLTPAAIAVAITIASHLDADTNHWAMSAKTLSKWTNGIVPSTIQRAVVALEALGVFQVSRERQRRPKDYRLLVECPKGCERLEVHNTPSELKALAKQSKKPKVETTQFDHSKTETTQFDYSQTLNLPKSVAQIELTNRTSIEPLIEKDEGKKSFELLKIKETLQKLQASNDYQPEHALLEKALGDQPDLIEQEAQRVMGKAAGNPRNYLETVITNTPLNLIPKQEKNRQETETQKWEKSLAKQNHASRIKAQYRALMDTNPELNENTINGDPTIGTLEFLVSVCPKDLNITAAIVANKAAYYGLQISHCKSVQQAGELTAVHPDLPAREIQRQRAKEAFERYKAATREAL